MSQLGHVKGLVAHPHGRTRHRGHWSRAERRRPQGRRHPWRDGVANVGRGHSSGQGPEKRRNGDFCGHLAVTARNADVDHDVVFVVLRLRASQTKIPGVFKSGKLSFLCTEHRRNEDECCCCG